MPEQDKPPQPQTSFLLARAKAAKAQAAKAQVKANAKVSSRQANVTSHNPANQQTANVSTGVTKSQDLIAVKPPNQPAATKAGKSPSRKAAPTEIRERKTDEDFAPAEASLLSEADAQIVDLIRQNATNPTAVDLFEPDLPGIIRAIIRSAQIIGIRGHQDRMTMFRIMGMPWTPQKGYQSATVKGETLDAMADRIARAVNRREGRLLGHDPVTVDVEPEPELAESLPGQG